MDTRRVVTRRVVTRRVLTVRSDGGGVRALIANEEPFQADASGADVLVRVAWTVVDPGVLGAGHANLLPDGVLGGVVERAPATGGLKRGDAVVGVGAPADLVSLPARSAHLLPAGGLASPVAPLLPIYPALAAALQPPGVMPRDRVLISGEGLVSALVVRIVRVGGGTARKVDPRGSMQDGTVAAARGDGDADVLIDTTADPRRWQRVLPRVRHEGRVVLLLPPGPRVLPFDFYPTVHRRSLSLVARRVPSAGDPVSPEEASGLVSEFLDRARMAPADVLVDVSMEPHPSEDALIRLDAVDHDRGLLVRWSGGQS
jgi:hypothetical protein